MNYPTPKKLHMQQCPEYNFIPEYKHTLELENLREPKIMIFAGMHGSGKTVETNRIIGSRPHFKINAETGEIIIITPEPSIITYNFLANKPENIFKKIKRKFRNLIWYIKIKKMVRDLAKKLG